MAVTVVGLAGRPPSRVAVACEGQVVRATSVAIAETGPGPAVLAVAVGAHDTGHACAGVDEVGVLLPLAPAPETATARPPTVGRLAGVALPGLGLRPAEGRPLAIPTALHAGVGVVGETVTRPFAEGGEDAVDGVGPTSRAARRPSKPGHVATLLAIEVT